MNDTIKLIEASSPVILAFFAILGPVVFGLMRKWDVEVRAINEGRQTVLSAEAVSFAIEQARKVHAAPGPNLTEEEQKAIALEYWERHAKQQSVPAPPVAVIEQKIDAAQPTVRASVQPPAMVVAPTLPAPFDVTRLPVPEFDERRTPPTDPPPGRSHL